jgi:hypothetical protein
MSITNLISLITNCRCLPSTPEQRSATCAKTAAFILALPLAITKTIQAGYFFISKNTVQVIRNSPQQNRIAQTAVAALGFTTALAMVTVYIGGLLAFKLPLYTRQSYAVMNNNNWEKFKVFMQQDITTNTQEQDQEVFPTYIV